jgi:adenylate cyclase
MDTAVDLVSQILGYKLQQQDIRQLLEVLSAQGREAFIDKIADILDKVVALLDLSNRAANAQSLDTLLARLIETTSAAIHAERGTVLLHDKARGELYAKIAQGAEINEIRIPDHTGIAGEVLHSGQAVIVHDAYADPRFNATVDKHTGYTTRNLLCAPIKTRTDDVIGVTQLLNKRHGTFTAEDLMLVEAMTSQVSATLQNAQLFAQMQRAREEERQFLEMTAAISTELQLQTLLTKLMATTTAMLVAERSTLFLHDEKTNELWSVVAQGAEINEIRIPSHLGIAGTVFTTRTTINIPDAYADPRFNPAIDKRTGYRTRSILCMPIINKEGKVIGVTQVLNKQGGPFTAIDEERLKAFSAQASIGIENAKLFEDISNMKNYNENILQSLSNGVMTLDAEKRIVKCNDAILHILKIDINKALGTYADDYFSVHNEWLINVINRVTATGEADLIMDTNFSLPNGNSLSVNLTALPLINVQKEIIGSMLVFEDITEEKRIKSTFGRYLSKEVVEELLSSPNGLKLGGEIREVTFLVSDLRGFTSMTSRLPPHDIIGILNRYLERMVDIIAQYRGTVDEFQGDGILAFFGAPLAASDDPERAIACAIEMHRALVEINTEQRHLCLPELVMGIGINTGEVIVGNIGSEKRSKYGAVGSAINTAYRIESYTVGGQILISPSTYERTRSLVQLRSTLEVQFKGLERPITLYNVAGLDGPYQLTVPEAAPESYTILEPPLPIACFLVRGKIVSGTAMPGHLTHLGAAAAKVSLPVHVAPHTNVKIILASREAFGVPAVYAKVVALDPPDSRTAPVIACLSFTSLPNDAKTFLEQLRM